MNQEVYKELLEVMKKRGGPYSGADIPEFFAMVEEMFNPEQAEVNNAMPRGPITADNMAEIMNKTKEEVEPILESMADHGLCQAVDMDGTQFYQSARFMPGILEYQFMPGTTTDRDKKLAKLIHDYEKAYDAITPKIENLFPTTRVITVDRTIDPEHTVNTHDQVKLYVDQAEHIAVTECFCRHAALLRGEKMHGMPNDVCMSFGAGALFVSQRLGGKLLSKEEALDVLKRSEDAGLIHMSSNTAEGVGFI